MADKTTATETVSDERLAKRIQNLKDDLAKNISPHERKMREEALSLMKELLSRRSLDTVDGVDKQAFDAAWKAIDPFHDQDPWRVDDYTKFLTAYLAASRPTRNAEVGVKALEWEVGSTCSIAQSAVGEYCLSFYEERDGCGWAVTLNDSTELGEFPTEMVAVDAAQADFETRIRSALAITEPEREPVAWPKPGWAVVPQAILDRWLDGCAFNDDSEDDCALLDQYRASMRAGPTSPPAQEAVTDAEPVAWHMNGEGPEWVERDKITFDKAYADTCAASNWWTVTPLYTSPPSPVLGVSDEMANMRETMWAKVIYEGEDNSFRFELNEEGNRDGPHYNRSIEFAADTFPAGTRIVVYEPDEEAALQLGKEG